MNDGLKLSIIIPAYNEKKTVIKLLETIITVNLDFNIKKEIVIINDCSTDNTESLINDFINTHSQYDIKLFSHSVNKGKGAAIQTGIKAADGDFIIIQDADLEYDPREYNLLIRPAIEGFADVVYGSRFMGGNPHRVLFFWHSIGNRFLTFLSNLFNKRDCFVILSLPLMMLPYEKIRINWLSFNTFFF